MGIYTGLFLVVIAISYLTVRFVRARSAVKVEKDGKSVSSQIRKQSHGSKQNGSRGNPADSTLGRSALVASVNHKPWGW